MTREEAIKRIGDIKRNYKRIVEIMTDNEAEALDMAIKALEQKPKTIQEIQAESEKYEKAFEDGYEQGYAQARFDYEQEPCEDAISREVVLRQLKGCLTGGEAEYQYVKLHIDSIPSVKPQEPFDIETYCKEHFMVMVDKDVWNKAEKALKQESCEDAISRQAAIDIIESWLSCDDCNEVERHIMRAMQSVLYDLPHVTPQQKTGYWIEHPHECGENWEYSKYECSECSEWEENNSEYCPNCGLKMVQESEVQNENCNICIHHKSDNPYCECCFDLNKFEPQESEE